MVRRIFFGGLVGLTLLSAGRVVAEDYLANTSYVIMATYKGQLLPVEKVSGSRPKVEVGNDWETGGAPFAFNFGPPIGAIHAVTWGPRPQRRVLMTESEDGVQMGGLQSLDTVMRATITADVALDDCYAAILYLNTASPTGLSGVVFQNIGRLRPDKEEELIFDIEKRLLHVGGVSSEVKMLLFSHGREVATSGSARAHAAIRLTRLHQGELQDYLRTFAGQDHPLVLVDQPEPRLPDGTDVGLLGPVEATLKVNDAGLVDNVVLSTALPKQVGKSVENALLTWSFLPRLKQGRAVATRVQVPIKLHAARSDGFNQRLDFPDRSSSLLPGNR